MAGEKDEEISASGLSVSGGEQPAPLTNDEPVPIARVGMRDFTQACRLLGTFFIFFITWGGWSL